MKLGKMVDLIRTNIPREFHEDQFTPSWSFKPKMMKISSKVALSIADISNDTKILEEPCGKIKP